MGLFKNIKMKVILLFLFIIILWLSIAIGVNSIYSLENAGLIGDSLNTANALFSALAFGAIVVSIYYQKIEFQEAKEDMKKTLAIQEENLLEFKSTKQSDLLIKSIDFHLKIKDSFNNIEHRKSSTRNSTPITRTSNSAITKWWKELDLAWHTGNRDDQKLMSFSEHIVSTNSHKEVQSLYFSISAIFELYQSMSDESRNSHLSLIKTAIGITESRIILMYDLIGLDSNEICKELECLNVISRNEMINTDKIIALLANI